MRNFNISMCSDWHISRMKTYLPWQIHYNKDFWQGGDVCISKGSSTALALCEIGNGNAQLTITDKACTPDCSSCSTDLYTKRSLYTDTYWSNKSYLYRRKIIKMMWHDYNSEMRLPTYKHWQNVWVLWELICLFSGYDGDFRYIFSRSSAEEWGKVEQFTLNFWDKTRFNRDSIGPALENMYLPVLFDKDEITLYSPAELPNNIFTCSQLSFWNNNTVI